MSTAAPIIRIKCHYCSKFAHPQEVQRLGDDILMCFECWMKHQVQVEAFHPPHECQECKRTFEQIAAATPGNQVRMYPHWKDGVYQILCVECDAVYVQKKRDLYQDTEFGWERKLR